MHLLTKWESFFQKFPYVDYFFGWYLKYLN
jgi:hypothetical protein